MEIGTVVTYVDPVRDEHPALVTAVHGEGDIPSLNVVYADPDAAKHDSYGRQIARATSVVNEANQHAPGNYWKA